MDSYASIIHLFCPRLNRDDWHLKEHHWVRKPFYSLSYACFFGLPLNLAAKTKNAVALLARRGLLDPIPITFGINEGAFHGDLLIAIKENVPDLETRAISGRFISFFFTGRYADHPRQIRHVMNYGRQHHLNFKHLYTWYATCPACAKKNGFAQMVIFAKIV